jgi:hypothetical protein
MVGSGVVWLRRAKKGQEWDVVDGDRRHQVTSRRGSFNQPVNVRHATPPTLREQRISYLVTLSGTIARNPFLAAVMSPLDFSACRSQHI